MKKFMRKGFAIVMALTMVFAMSVSAFADTAGTATMKYYIPTSYTNELTSEVKVPTIPSYYTDSSVSGMKGVSAEVDLSGITGWLVTPPENFQGLYNYDSSVPYIPTVFDVLYAGGTSKGETAGEDGTANKSMTYGFDTYSYSESGVPMHGIYFGKLSNLSTDTFDSYYDPADGSGYWMGYSWSLYAVPASETNFNPAAPDATYKTDLYANNIAAADGYTYYMIFEYNEEMW